MPNEINDYPPGLEWGANEREDPPRSSGDWFRLRAGELTELELPAYWRDRDNWMDVNMDYMVSLCGGVYDQLDGHCTANQCTMGLNIVISNQSGEVYRGCPSQLYREHSRDGTGSTLYENVVAATNVGVVPIDVVAMDYRRLPEDYRVLASHARLDEVWDINGDLDGIAVALQLRFPVGVGAGRPAWGGGHSTLCTSFIKGAAPDDDVFGGPNSHGTSYAAGLATKPGYWAFTRRTLIRSGAARFSSYAYRSATFSSNYSFAPQQHFGVE